MISKSHQAEEGIVWDASSQRCSECHGGIALSELVGEELLTSSSSSSSSSSPWKPLVSGWEWWGLVGPGEIPKSITIHISHYIQHLERKHLDTSLVKHQPAFSCVLGMHYSPAINIRVR